MGLWAQAAEQHKQVNWEALSSASAGSQSRRETQLSAWDPRGAAEAVRGQVEGSRFQTLSVLLHTHHPLAIADPWHILVSKFCSHLLPASAMGLFCMSLN